MKALLTLFTFLILYSSCKKDRECECKNAGGTYWAGEVTATKAQAKKICKDLSTSSTECYLK